MNLKYWITVAMNDYGGSFVKALGECVRHADDQNYTKLVQAFPDYFKKYTELAKRLKAEDDAKP